MLIAIVHKVVISVSILGLSHVLKFSRHNETLQCCNERHNEIS